MVKTWRAATGHASEGSGDSAAGVARLDGVEDEGGAAERAARVPEVDAHHEQPPASGAMLRVPERLARRPAAARAPAARRAAEDDDLGIEQVGQAPRRRGRAGGRPRRAPSVTAASRVRARRIDVVDLGLRVAVEVPSTLLQDAG